MKTNLILSACLVAALSSTSFADPVRNSNTDIALVSAEITSISVHVGEKSAGANIEIASKDCFNVIKNYQDIAEFDCSSALSAKLGQVNPALAKAPLVYPAYFEAFQDRTSSTNPNQPALYDDAATGHILKIVTATTLDAADAQTFSGIGMYRMGYPTRAEQIYSAYNLNDPAVNASYQNTLALQEVFPLAQLSAVTQTGIRKSDGKPVVFHVFTMLVIQNYYSLISSITNNVPQTNWSNIALHPFAQFTANGQAFWNYEAKNGDYNFPSTAPVGFVVDQRANYSSAP